MNQPNQYAFARMAAQGDFRPVQAGLHTLHRGQWIICRSAFGLELAEVLSDTQVFSELAEDANSPESSMVHWVRDATSQDHWLWEKLQSINLNAIDICQEYLNNLHSNDTLLEIASSIDGKSVAFEFLGQASEETNQQLEKLSEIYQAFVRDSEIYKQIEVGCGPGCGTTASCRSASDGRSGCQSCGIASRCKKH